MRNPGKDAEQIIQSYPFKVRFAGMAGDTLSLASQGWSFAMNQQMNAMHGEMLLHMIVKHEGMGLFGYTNYIRIERYNMSPHEYMQNLMHYAEMGFEIAHIAQSMRIAVPSAVSIGRAATFGDAYGMIDPRPSYSEFNLDNLKFFKPANPQLKDIIVHPSQVPEMMEMILKAQKSVIGEIKARENSRANYEKQFGVAVKPAHEAHIQIVSLA